MNLKKRLWKFAPYRFVYFRFLGLYCDWYADYSVVSYQKSGHTWLRVMLAKVISLKYGIKNLDLDIIWMAKKPVVPKIAIFHPQVGIGLYLFDWKKIKFTGIYSKSEKIKIRNSLKNKKIILLVRDPRDVVVSLYFELTRRHSLYTGNISQFIKEDYTLKKIIRCMNLWQRERQRRSQDFLLLRYEDMKKNCAHELKRVTDFVGIPTHTKIIKEAVHFGTIENMRKIEDQDLFGDNRLRAKNSRDKESYKVRKGQVGGYTDYLSKEDIYYLNEKIKLNLHPSFGY